MREDEIAGVGRGAGPSSGLDPLQEEGPILEIVGASRSYLRGDQSVVALHEVTFAVRGEEMVALVGPSGCGKSTTLNLASGVDRPDRGRVVVCGIDIGAATEAELVRLRRHSIGVVFQAFHLMQHLTVEENVALPLALSGVRDTERVHSLLSRVGLGHRLGHYPSELSGGEQQRTAIARALVQRPRLLLADEPTGNLDSASGTAVLHAMEELRRAEGSALLLATHDERIAAMADRVIRMADGRIQVIL